MSSNQSTKVIVLVRHEKPPTREVDIFDSSRLGKGPNHKGGNVELISSGCNAQSMHNNGISLCLMCSEKRRADGESAYDASTTNADNWLCHLLSSWKLKIRLLSRLGLLGRLSATSCSGLCRRLSTTTSSSTLRSLRLLLVLWLLHRN